MKRTNLEDWIETTEALPVLTREGLEDLQLRRLNETLAKLKARGGFYKDCPEKLDSRLFRIPELIDYRASMDRCLIIEARMSASNMETQIYSAAKTRYPDLQIEVHTSIHRNSDRPMYLGKRHIVQEQAIVR